MKKSGLGMWIGACLVAALGANACGKTGSSTSSETNWLSECESSADCVLGACHCGVCTKTCEGSSDCGELANASCATQDSAAYDAQCSRGETNQGICLPNCGTDAECASGQRCVAGSCVMGGTTGLGTGGTTDGSGATSNASDTSSGGTGTGSGGSVASVCGDVRRQDCLPDCDSWECGKETSSFDANGCLRELCSTDADCPSDERCFTGEEEGGAAGAGSDADGVCVNGVGSCFSEQNGTCSCGGATICDGYCVPR
jgi:hypothetical protein